MSLSSANRDNGPGNMPISPHHAQGSGRASAGAASCTGTSPASQIATDKRVDGLKLLSLDTGGLRGISQLQILAEVMNGVSREDDTYPEFIQRRPYEVFDVIGGVGTGGLIAILLAVFKMTASEALQEFTRFAPEVFIETILEPKTRTEMLRQIITRLLERHAIDGTATLLAVNGSTSSCKLIVPVRYKDHVGAVCILRNYITAHEPPTSLTITEAMLATCSTPPMFIPTSISKDFAIFAYVSGDAAVSNPTREIIAEAHRTFGDEAPVACLLSIGSGHPGVNSVPTDSHAPSWGDFYRHIAVEGERTAEEMAIQMGKLTLYHRLSVIHGLEARTGPLREDVDTIVCSTTSYLKDLEVAETVDRCVEAIKDADGLTTLVQLRHSGGTRILPPPLPPLTPNYVERKDPMAFIKNALFKNNGTIKDGSKKLVVTGIGGCGKTQLIRKFVETHGNRFNPIIFIDGSSKEAIRRGITQHTGHHVSASLSSAMSVFARPSFDGERLMIMDNFDDPQLNLGEYLPGWLQGTFIVTSRNHFRGQLSPQAHLQLDSMSRSESVELIVRGLGQEWPPSEDNKEAATLVADELSCHPLALVQAIGYMYSTGYSPETYVSRLQSHRERLLRKPATIQIDMRYQSAFAAFDASYDVLPLNAQRIIQFLSFFHWEDFPLELVIFGAENAFSIDEYRYLPRGEEFQLAIAYLSALVCPSGGWDLDDLDSLIVALRNHSLVKVRSINKITLLQIHPLVHEWARLRVPSKDVEATLAAARRLLSCAAKYDNPSIVQYLVAHIQKVSSPLEDLHANDIASFGRILLESGMYSECAKLQECCLTTLNHQLGPDGAATISAAAILGITYGKMGDSSAALRLKEDVMERRERLLGMDHPDTLHTYASIAVTYSDQGRYVEAEVLQDTVLKGRTHLLGVDHSETILASANLAATYGHMGRHAEAQALEEAVFAQYKKLLGMGHPCTLDIAANLAITHVQQGRYKEAEDMQGEVLQSRILSMGEQHPHTLRDMLTMGRIYHETERNSEAFELVQRARRIALETLDKSHPISIKASMNLASLMFENPEYAPDDISYDSDDPRMLYYYSNRAPPRFPWPIKRSPAGRPEHSSNAAAEEEDSGDTSNSSAAAHNILPGAYKSPVEGEINQRYAV